MTSTFVGLIGQSKFKSHGEPLTEEKLLRYCREEFISLETESRGLWLLQLKESPKTSAIVDDLLQGLGRRMVSRLGLAIFGDDLNTLAQSGLNAYKVGQDSAYTSFHVTLGPSVGLLKGLEGADTSRINELSANLISSLAKPDFTFSRKTSPTTLEFWIEYSPKRHWVLIVAPREVISHRPPPREEDSFEGLLVHFDEAYLKGANRDTIQRATIQNLKTQLEPLKVPTTLTNCHAVLRVGSDAVEAVKRTVSCVPGFSDGYHCLTIKNALFNIEDITRSVLAKVDPSVLQLQITVRMSEAGGTLEKSPVKEHLRDAIRTAFPTIELKTRCPAKIIVYLSRASAVICWAPFKGMGGLPTTPGQSVVCLLSGGFDSSVAAYLLMKRGCRVHFVHFQNENQMEGMVKDKILRLAEHLSRFQGKTSLHIVPFADVQRQIIEKVPAAERMLVYRHFMTLIASKIATSKNAPFLCTGDSMGQVASQTIRNLQAVYHYSPKPILAPLMGMNKSEIIALSEAIGTADLSKLPYGDCCSYFLAKHPALHLREPEGALKVLAGVATTFSANDLASQALQDSAIFRITRPGSIKEVRGFSSRAQKLTKTDAVCLVEASPALPSISAELLGEGEKQQIPDVVSKVISVAVTERSRCYLDWAATTDCPPEVVTSMIPFFVSSFQNPSSSHESGRGLAAAISDSRSLIAEILGVKFPSEILFLGSATEANNLVLRGIVQRAHQEGNKLPHLITTQIEHPSVLETVKDLQRQNLCEATYLPVDKEGFVSPDTLKSAIKSNTVLVSIIHGNNEVGVLQDLATLGQVCSDAGVLFHTDACQSFTKTPITVSELKIDFVTINAHKVTCLS